MQVTVGRIHCGVVTNIDGEPCSNVATNHIKAVTNIGDVLVYQGPACIDCIKRLQARVYEDQTLAQGTTVRVDT